MDTRQTVAQKVLEFAEKVEREGLFLPDVRRNGFWQAVFYHDPMVQEDGKKLSKSWKRQELYECSFCGNVIEDYDEEYRADRGEDGCIVYAAKCGVCRDCAIKKSDSARFALYPYIKNSWERRENGKDVAVHEYSDGCIVEGIVSSNFVLKEA